MPHIGLVEELGCGNCHIGAQKSNIVLQRAPDLNYARLKYNEAYLFDYLSAPKKFRNNIGKSRMPNFGFSDDEAFALTKYLMIQDKLPDGEKLKEISPIKSTDGFELIHVDYQCTSCHILNNFGNKRSTDLTIAGVRLKRDWLFDFVQNPSVYVPKGSSMPDFFGNDTGHNLGKNSNNTILSMVSYLLEIGTEKHNELDVRYTKVKQTYPNITAEMGRSIFLSQNCQSCHEMSNEIPWYQTNAPDLTAQRMRTKKGWLTHYLKSPTAIRPFGYLPGTGSRMPDFQLTDSEVEELSKWLGEAKLKTVLEPISAFQSRKVERLFNDFLPCIGCHQLDGKGGMIGPDLSNVGNRLSDGFIKMAVTNPHMVMPGSTMPKTIMDSRFIPLILSYLASRKSDQKASYPNLIEQIPYNVVDNYGANCAPCHGLNGDGNGFNASNLPVEPGDFTNSDLLGNKSDDTLFDTIYVGGRVMNKSHFMPGWGEKLSRSDIIKHIQKIRDFCACEAPDWANN